MDTLATILVGLLATLALLTLVCGAFYLLYRVAMYYLLRDLD